MFQVKSFTSTYNYNRKPIKPHLKFYKILVRLPRHGFLSQIGFRSPLKKKLTKDRFRINSLLGNFQIKYLVKSLKLNLIPLLAEQPQHNMLIRDIFESGYGILFDNYRLGSTVWSPFCSGILTRKKEGNSPATS